MIRISRLATPKWKVENLNIFDKTNDISIKELLSIVYVYITDKYHTASILIFLTQSIIVA